MSEAIFSPETEELIGPGEVEETRPVRVEARPGFTIWLEFAEGSNGLIDFSDVAQGPAFARWQDRAYFESVHIDDYGDIAWADDLQLCADSLYMKLTGCSVDKVWPAYAGNVDRV